PQGPQTRGVLQGLIPDHRLLPFDNVPLLDIDDWRANRLPLAGRRPVIGRYSRDALEKWPASKAAIETVYCVSGADTRIMGGDRAIARYFGDAPPASWTVLPEGGQEPRDFLSRIDFFVYFHHPNLLESFGRS